MQDVRMPGMVHGARGAPAGLDSTLVSVDGSPGKHAGLIKVVVKKNFVGVVCRARGAGDQGRRALKVTWNDRAAAELRRSSTAHAEPGRPRPACWSTRGDVDAALAGAAKKLEATYHYPFQLHGSMGPSCAVADVKGDEATVWSSTQGVYPLRGAVARRSAFPSRTCTSSTSRAPAATG